MWAAPKFSKSKVTKSHACVWLSVVNASWFHNATLKEHGEPFAWQPPIQPSIHDAFNISTVNSMNLMSLFTFVLIKFGSYENEGGTISVG